MELRTKIIIAVVITIIVGVLLYSFLLKQSKKSSSKDALSLEVGKQTIKFNSLDDIEITADVYMTENKNAPFILLFHQARYSRGEYIEIAPKLNQLGFNCMAIDQRSGFSVNNIVNETAARAAENNKPTSYTDAFIDVEAAFLYVKNNIKPDKLIIWGSSYSSSLAFVLAAKYPDDIDALLAFSPGEYFKIDGKKIEDFSKECTLPSFVTSSLNEKSSWEGIFEMLSSDKKVSFIPKENPGMHGSSALFESTLGYKEYWIAVEEFLKNLR